MSEDQAYVVDRTGWPPGPWDGEPDKLQWATAAGYPALAVRHEAGGHWCGYVGVPPGHPAHERMYRDVPIRVHGDLTYAAPCQADGPVCHVPAPGEPDAVWWLGFDCGHWFDLQPGIAALLHRIRGAAASIGLFGMGWETYRTLAYVREEVESLAVQLAAIAARGRLDDGPSE